MNKELQEALTICRENEAKLEKIYDKMYTFWKRNIQPCIEQSNKHVGERIYLPEKDIHIIIQSYFFNYHANRNAGNRLLAVYRRRYVLCSTGVNTSGNEKISGENFSCSR